MVDLLGDVKLVFRVALSALFLFAGYLHWRRTGLIAAMVPRWVPFRMHRRLVLAVGAAQLVLAGMLHVDAARRVAGWGAALLMLAVWPADLHNVLERNRKKKEDLGFERKLPLPGERDVVEWLLWVRLPLQPFFMLWAWFCTS